MTARHVKQRPRRFFALGAAAALAVFSVPASASAAHASKGNKNDKQTICHATDSNTNPYVVVTPNKNGDLDGHAKHTGPVWNPTLKGAHIKWGDIIPPFDYNSHGTPAHYPGLNWTSAGRAIFDNGCRIPAAPTPITASVVKTNDANGDGTFTGDETASSVGASVPFKVVITNTSSTAAVLSSLVDVVAGSPLAFACASSVLGTTLAPGASATCLFTATGYSPANGGAVVNTVTATLHQVGNPGNSGSANASSTVRTLLPPPAAPDVAIVKTAPATAAPGGTITWTLTVSNTGTVPSPATAIADTLPAGLTLVSATGTGWTCTGTTSLSCTLGPDLAVGATSVVTVVTTLSAGFTGTSISNTAVVTPTDVTPADNTSTATVAVTQPTGGGGGGVTGGGGGVVTGGGGGAVGTPSSRGVHPPTRGGGGPVTAPSTLPRTGAPTGMEATYGAAMLLAGIGLLLMTPRRRRVPAH